MWGGEGLLQPEETLKVAIRQFKNEKLKFIATMKRAGRGEVIC
jgi:hypothetical protein